MTFPDELLELSSELAMLDRQHPRQASLRRAVSTAYYALFHLLIAEATLNWGHAAQWPALGRIFDHGRMKSASEEKRAELKRLLENRSAAPIGAGAIGHLYSVVSIFIEAQQRRHEADYDNAKEWTRVDVLLLIGKVIEAFSRWTLIREHPVAQAYLLSLLIGRSRRSE